MHRGDFDAFSEMLDAVCSLLSRGSYVPSAQNTALFFRALAKHDLRDVRAAFDAHVSDPVRGRYVPVPADILAQIENRVADDGRPGAEEAWGIVVAGMDEAKTIVWTAEMAEAAGVARAIHAAGDEVGARMAFREAYTRMVDEARRLRRPAVWTPSLGTDASQHQPALDAAHSCGRLAAPERLALPAPANAFDAITSNPSMPAGVREKLLRLRESLVAKANEPSTDARARAATAEMKRASADRVNAYQSGATC